MGLSPKHVLICEDGDQIEVSAKGIRRAGKVPAGFHYIDGSSSDLDERPLEERRMLAEYGVLLIAAGVDKELAKLVQPVSVTARGWFEGSSDAQVLVNLTNAVRTAIQEAIQSCPALGRATSGAALSPTARHHDGRGRGLDVALYGLAVVGVAETTAPEGLVADLLFNESPIEQRALNDAHHMKLAEEVGVTEVGRQCERRQSAEQSRGVTGGSTLSVDEDARHAESFVKRGTQRVIGGVDLDDEDGAPGHVDALGHAVERGEAARVADEEVPISEWIERDLAARSNDVHELAGLGVLDPRTAGADVINGEPERDRVVGFIDRAHAVTAPHGSTVVVFKANHHVTARMPADRRGVTGQDHLVYRRAQGCRGHDLAESGRGVQSLRELFG
jgi:hypothetical protein